MRYLSIIWGCFNLVLVLTVGFMRSHNGGFLLWPMLLLGIGLLITSFKIKKWAVYILLIMFLLYALNLLIIMTNLI